MTSRLRPSRWRLLGPLLLLGALGGCAVAPVQPGYPGDVVVMPPPVTGQVWLYGGSGGYHPGYRHAPPPAAALGGAAPAALGRPTAALGGTPVGTAAVARAGAWARPAAARLAARTR
ncbi:hypothetical protein [Aquabacterium sp. J223]|uniref:hypothetical protein n=1 Tax=Aquabacterium sp. J223 TaxID=2898431 RepID=UPI0021ADBDE3|nr:hypothetical protein [Aquabacterium sp. J223]UUX96122.1 hypothetical protein LRS07_01950 [Aquabacterium sp. J223]